MRCDPTCPLHGDNAPPCFAYHPDDTDEASVAFFRGVAYGRQEQDELRGILNDLMQDYESCCANTILRQPFASPAFQRGVAAIGYKCQAAIRAEQQALDTAQDEGRP